MRKKILNHLGIWIVFSIIYLWAFIPSFWELSGELLQSKVIFKLSYIPFIAIAVYLNFYILIPLFLFKKKHILYLASLSFFWFYAKAIYKLCQLYIVPKTTEFIDSLINFINPPKEVDNLTFYISSLSPSDLITDIFISLLLSIIIAILIDRYKREVKAELLEKQKLHAELKFLKAQIQPHFLMNSLNNLYGMVLPISKDASNVIIGLSEILRYIIYESKETYVSIKKEVDMIKHYLELEKVRLGEKVDINFSVEGSLDSYKIPPTLLIVFIENSFKHGAYSSIENGWLDISLSVENQVLFFKIENSIEVNKIKKLKEIGIGIANVRKRLDLLYPNNYSLKIFNEEESYLVVLEIKL